MKKANSIAKVAITAGLAFGLIAAGASTAQAEPNPVEFRTYVAVGSDTIQDIYNAFSNGYGTVAAIAPTVASYNAFGSATIKTSATGPTFTRPAGSGDGRKALSAAYDPANHVWKTVTLSEADVKIGRSSGKPSSTNTVTNPASTDNKLTSVPFARDAVGVATKGISASVANLSTDQLTAIFGGGASGSVSASGNYRLSTTRFNIGDVVRSTGGTADPVIVTGVTANGAAVSASVQLNPKLPQDGSGTRSFFLGAVGASTQATWVDSGTVPYQENNATVLSATGDIIPFSAGQYISQRNGVVADTGVANINVPNINGDTVFVLAAGGKAAAGAIYGNVAAPANGSFNREVYSVVPTALLASDADLKKLVTTTLPQAESTIVAFGFQKLTYNTTTPGTVGYIYSKFEH